jgi:uracil-DNA glycosylase
MDNKMLPANIDSSWHAFLNDGGFKMINKIAAETGKNINPDAENVLRFLKVNLDNVKVVILGQDPYPQKGIATGRAFEVGGLASWRQNFRQISLKNIVRLLHKNYNRIFSYEDILSFRQIQNEIETGKFPILPPDKLFESWENQGVLLLNTSFTCIPGMPGSHELYGMTFPVGFYHTYLHGLNAIGFFGGNIRSREWCILKREYFTFQDTRCYALQNMKTIS